ncbi:uncharacterized protein LOC133031286 [Cannabis sativa]|uniref:uncharacterized protein LOC133031286 n=1 Tax=Cannabis sativa TaxID=3483 RepID=UPI0029CAA6D3|nr:uncharacterized protein LOC133031286 [Cannabis sativa]
MASSSHVDFDLNEQYAQISLEDEEAGVLIGGDDEGDETTFDDRWCLVRKFLTGRPVDFDAMRHLMASLWQPGKGVFIKELGTNRYLFQFFHELDVQTVIDGSPWTFNRSPLVFHRLNKGEDPKEVALHKLDFWVQIHDLKSGYMLEKVVRSAGAYIGTYVKSDPKNFNGLWREYLRVRTTVDIEKPLKRRMKLCKENGDWIWANFKYEHLPTFCFVCGIIGHADRFSPKRFDQPMDQLVKPYGAALRADLKKKNYLVGAKWLRSGAEEGGAAAGCGGGGRVTEDLHGVKAIPKIMDVDCVDHIGDHDPMTLGKSKKKEIIKESGREIMQSAIDGNSEFMESDDDANIEEDLVVLMESGPWCTCPPIIMSIIYWNCHGLGNPWAQQFLKDLVVQKKPSYLFLCETLAKKDIVERIRVAIGFEGALAVDCQGRSGGVALLWREEEDVRVLEYGLSYIDVVVCGSDQGHWRLTGIYGEPNRSLRKRTWDLIRELKNKSSLPWCIIGDLNNVTSQEDKKGGHPYPRWLVDGFNDTLMDCGLHDLELYGYPYTWERSRGTPDWVEVRIDRAMVTQSWLDFFPLAKLFNLEVSTSDHTPLHLVLINEVVVAKRHVFRFENSWLKEPLFFEIVKICWDNGEPRGVMEKIKCCGDVLWHWGKDYSGNFPKRIKDCKLELQKWKRGRDGVSVENYKNASANLNSVLLQREIFWKQRSKQLWLREGDSNSKYFHASATSRRRRNSIQKLKDSDGVWVD